MSSGLSSWDACVHECTSHLLRPRMKKLHEEQRRTRDGPRRMKHLRRNGSTCRISHCWLWFSADLERMSAAAVCLVLVVSSTALRDPDCVRYDHIHERTEAGRSHRFTLCTTADGNVVRLRETRVHFSNRHRRLHLDFIAQQNAAPTTQTLLTIVCLYSGAALTASTASQSFWQSDTFGATASVDAAYRLSSYGRVGFNQVGSRYMTATMGSGAPADCADATVTAQREACKQQALTADASLDLSAFDHVEFWMPYELPCGWVGLANLCVSDAHLGAPPAGTGASCWSMTRADSSGGTLYTQRDTRIHEMCVVTHGVLSRCHRPSSARRALFSRPPMVPHAPSSHSLDEAPWINACFFRRGHNMGMSHATGYEAE